MGLIKTSNFKECLNWSKKYEDHVIEYIKSRDYYLEVQDVRNNKLYRKQDIDVLGMFNSYEFDGIEIKCTEYPAKNYFIEVFSNYQWNKYGWLYKSKCNYLFYYFAKARELHTINFESLKSYKKENDIKNFKLGYVNTEVDKEKEEYYTTIGFLLPIEEAKRNINLKIIKGV